MLHDDNTKKLSAVLREINDLLWDHQYSNAHEPIGFDKYDLVYATKIFTTALFEVMWAARGNKPIDFIAGEAENCGSYIKDLIKQCTGLDMKTLIVEDLKNRPDASHC